MNTIAETKTRITQQTESNNVIDTTFVLFFLAIEFGRTLMSFNLDTICVGLTLLALMILPYFLLSGEKSVFGNWLLGRGFIVSLAVLLGVTFNLSLGTVLPSSFKFLPMTFLIVTAMVSCYFQFYSFLNLRFIK